jgi:hypothetical protein
MTRIATALVTAAMSAEAFAHPGHLGTAGGHGHWELLGGIAVLALAAGVAALATRRRT